MNLFRSEEMSPPERVALLQGDEAQEAESQASVSAAPVTRLLRGFQRESRRYQRRLRTAIRLVVAGAGLIALIDALSALIAVHRGAEALPLGFILTSWILYGLALGLIPIPVFTARAARDRLRDRLSGYDDIRVIGPLAEMLRAPDPALREAAVEALIRLLPRLRRSDAALLNAEQRNCLCSALHGYRNGETGLPLAVLQAFAEVGESDVLPHVERLADAAARSRRQKAVRAAARAALPALQEHARQEQASRTLLRASACVTLPETLLRPAAGRTRPDEANLLLPGTPPPPTE